MSALTDRKTITGVIFPLGALAGMIIYFALMAPSFLTLSNLQVLSSQMGPLLMVSLGGTFVIVMGSIDLSVGSIVLLAGAIDAVLLAKLDAPAWVVVLATIGVGLVAGSLNGLVFAYGRVPSFITTLGSLSVFAGLGLIILNGSPLSFVSPSFSRLAIGHAVPFIQNTALWGLGFWALAVLVGYRTRFGKYMYALGSGERVARLSGIPVNRYKVYALAISGATAALAGMLGAGQLGAGSPTLGSTMLLDSLAAIVLGGTALTGGSGGVHRTLLGVVIIAILSNGLNQMGVGSFTQEVIKGMVIVIAAGITMLSQRQLVIK